MTKMNGQRPHVDSEGVRRWAPGAVEGSRRAAGRDAVGEDVCRHAGERAKRCPDAFAVYWEMEAR